MKLVNKPIQVISVANELGEITPIRFKLIEDEEEKVIKIGRVVLTNTEKKNGNYMKLFQCESMIENKMIFYVLKYELSSCKWQLYKI